MFLYLFSFSAPKMQSIETQQPFPVPAMFICSSAYKRESGLVLAYLNEIFN